MSVGQGGSRIVTLISAFGSGIDECSNALLDYPLVELKGPVDAGP